MISATIQLITDRPPPAPFLPSRLASRWKTSNPTVNKVRSGLSLPWKPPNLPNSNSLSVKWPLNGPEIPATCLHFTFAFALEEMSDEAWCIIIAVCARRLCEVLAPRFSRTRQIQASEEEKGETEGNLWELENAVQRGRKGGEGWKR